MVGHGFGAGRRQWSGSKRYRFNADVPSGGGRHPLASASLGHGVLARAWRSSCALSYKIPKLARASLQASPRLNSQLAWASLRASCPRWSEASAELMWLSFARSPRLWAVIRRSCSRSLSP